MLNILQRLEYKENLSVCMLTDLFYLVSVTKASDLFLIETLRCHDALAVALVRCFRIPAIIQFLVFVSKKLK